MRQQCTVFEETVAGPGYTFFCGPTDPLSNGTILGYFCRNFAQKTNTFCIYCYISQIFLGKLARMVFMRGEVYTALPSDISVTEASSELRYVNANDELGLDSSQPLPKSPTMALEKV